MTFFIITENNESQEFELSQLRGRRDTSKVSRCLDKEKNYVTVDSSVKVLKGGKNTIGKVVYIYKGVIFVKTMDTLPYQALKSKDILSENKTENLEPTLYMQRNREVDKIGSTVRVIQGFYKGKVGTIKTVTRMRNNIKFSK